MKTILVGYDGSDAAHRALDRAAQLARALGGKVVVTSVAPVLVGAAAGHGLGPLDPVDPPEEHEQQLVEAKQILAAHGVSADVRLAIGDPPAAIVEVARQVGADTIVVGTRELGFFERMLGGSVSDGVVHRAHCDVLIVH